VTQLPTGHLTQMYPLLLYILLVALIISVRTAEHSACHERNMIMCN